MQEELTDVLFEELTENQQADLEDPVHRYVLAEKLAYKLLEGRDPYRAARRRWDRLAARLTSFLPSGWRNGKGV